MLVSLTLALLALRKGLQLRRARLRRSPKDPHARRAHLRIAKPAVALALAGFTLGPISAVTLRGWEAFASVHGVLGLIAATLFTATALTGRRIEHGKAQNPETHARLAGLAVLIAGVAAVAGFALLP
jgi:hypothetical protein